MENLPVELIINIVSKMEIKEMYKVCSQNKRIYDICKENNKIIMMNYFKNKGYTKGVEIVSKSPIFIQTFYKIDPEIKNTSLNIIKAFQKVFDNNIYYYIVKFMLLNRPSTKLIDEYKKIYDDYQIVDLLVVDRIDSLKNKNQSQIDLLVEIIRYSYSEKTFSDDTLNYLKQESGYNGNLNDNWKKCLTEEIKKLTTAKFWIDARIHIGWHVSAMTKRWEYYLEDENIYYDYTPQNRIYKTLLQCSN